jgi:hypothetical protein
VAVTFPGNVGWCLQPKPPSPCAGQIAIKPDPDVPDPAIYSQDELLAIGPFTFENPDIALGIDPVLTGGTWIFPGPRVLPAAKVTVHNLSNKVSAINTLVGCSTTLFGIGFPRVSLGTQLVSIPSGGQADLFFSVPPPPPTWQGDVLLVELSHPCDRRLINNRGWYAVAPIPTQTSGGTVQIPFNVWNESADQRTIDLTLLPNTLNGTVSPQSFVCPPAAPFAAAIDVDEPPNPPSQGQVSVIATTAGSLIGGITFKIFASRP